MIFGDNHYIYNTYSAAGEKLMTQYQFHMLPVHAPMSSEGETQEADGMSGSVMENTRSGPATPIDTDHIYYCGNMVYDRGVTRLLTDEGYVTFSETGAPVYHYFLRDHLGNVRVVMDQTGNIEQVNHYYAFGGLMRESVSPGLQPYKYGGKELDRYAGLDAYDFGARSYFADRMQWGTMDPMCEKFYDVSPYGYCHNDPINRFDSNGMDDIFDIYGNFLIDTGKGSSVLIQKNDGSTFPLSSFSYYSPDNQKMLIKVSSYYLMKSDTESFDLTIYSSLKSENVFAWDTQDLSYNECI